MSFTKRVTTGLVVLAMAGAVSPASSQVGPAGVGRRIFGVGPRLGENIQLALQNQDRLGLSSDQVGQLQELQAGVERDVMPLEDEIEAIRSSLQAGNVGYAEGQARLQDLLVRYETAAEPYRTGVNDVLTPSQHDTLRWMMFDSRPYPQMGYGWAGAGYGRAGVGYGRAGVGYGRVAPGVAWGGRGFGRGIGRGAGWGFRRFRW